MTMVFVVEGELLKCGPGLSLLKLFTRVALAASLANQYFIGRILLRLC
jgi:hypothetical protein